jgi:hypothetical protein
MVGLGIAVAIAAGWSAARDDAMAKAGAARRMSFATEPIPAGAQDPSPRDGGFSTHHALQRLLPLRRPGGAAVGFWFLVSGLPDTRGCEYRARLWILENASGRENQKPET